MGPKQDLTNYDDEDSPDEEAVPQNEQGPVQSRFFAQHSDQGVDEMHGKPGPLKTPQNGVQRDPLLSSESQESMAADSDDDDFVDQHRARKRLKSSAETPETTERRPAGQKGHSITSASWAASGPHEAPRRQEASEFVAERSTSQPPEPITVGCITAAWNNCNIVPGKSMLPPSVLQVCDFPKLAEGSKSSLVLSDQIHYFRAICSHDLRTQLDTEGLQKCCPRPSPRRCNSLHRNRDGN